MGLCLLRIVLYSVIQVLQLLVANAPEGLDEVRELLSNLVSFRLPLRDHLNQRTYLLVVVGADFGLDGLGARHGCFTAHDGRRPTQAGGEGGPHGVQCCRANAVFVDESIESIEVGGFLVVHVLH